MPSESLGGAARFTDRILEQLLLLRAGDGVELVESRDPRGLWEHRFRAGGDVVRVILDSTVLEVRAYAGNDVVGTGRVPERVLGMLVGDVPLPDDMGRGTTVEEARAALRAIVGNWRRRNARLAISSPNVARHPDGWNGA